MKARVKATGEILNVYNWGNPTYRATDGSLYEKDELDFDFSYTPDYWEKLKHQYAGMAMQGMLSNAIGFDEVRKQAAESGINNLITLIAGAATDYATALVENLKSESNEKV